MEPSDPPPQEDRPRGLSQGERYISGIFEVPISSLDLSPPDTRIHLKILKTMDGYRGHVWSPGPDVEPLETWARKQGGWGISEPERSPRGSITFEILQLPTGLSWLAPLSSVQNLILDLDGTARIRLLGSRENLREIHDRLASLGEVHILRVVDRAYGADPDAESAGRVPGLTDAQAEAIEAALVAGYFEVPREIQLAELAEQLDRARSSLSSLLRRGLARLVELHFEGGTDPEAGADAKTAKAEEDPRV